MMKRRGKKRMEFKIKIKKLSKIETRKMETTLGGKIMLKLK